MIGIVVGTRPELIKIFPIVKFFKQKKVKYKIIHTGQHYSKNLNEIFLENFSILKPNYNLKIGSKPHAEQTALMMIGLEKILHEKFRLNKSDKNLQFVLGELGAMREYLQTPGASVKMILEHIALVL